MEDSGMSKHDMVNWTKREKEYASHCDECADDVAKYVQWRVRLANKKISAFKRRLERLLYPFWEAKETNA
jgi:hypothetical protein